MSSRRVTPPYSHKPHDPLTTDMYMASPAPAPASRAQQAFTVFIGVGLINQFFRLVTQPGLPAFYKVLLGFGALVLLAVIFGVALVRRTLRYCDDRPWHQVVRTGELARDPMPPSEAMYVVLLFEWRLFGSGWMHRMMARKWVGSAGTWDVPFVIMGLDPESEVLAFCARYGMPEEPWVWSKKAAAYESMSAWMARRLRRELSPEALATQSDEATLVAPAAGTVDWLGAAAELPATVQHVHFALAKCGLPEYGRCAAAALAPTFGSSTTTATAIITTITATIAITTTITSPLTTFATSLLFRAQVRASSMRAVARRTGRLPMGPRACGGCAHARVAAQRRHVAASLRAEEQETAHQPQSAAGDFVRRRSREWPGRRE